MDYDGGTIRRVQYFAACQPPTAVATASPTSGPAPLTVNFDGSGSTDPDPGDTIGYSWDLNGDGVYGDSTLAKPTYTYAQPGVYTVRLRVTDNQGASTISAPITITANNTPPTPTAPPAYPPASTSTSFPIDQPSPTLTWKVSSDKDRANNRSGLRPGNCRGSSAQMVLLRMTARADQM